MALLNLGILAHVDAGKTSLTERLLYDAAVIDQVGSVDDGSTQTDSLALERRRGITIKSAVVSFTVDDLTVNLVDTPGHPDFIAEVERVLGVLDGAVLVVSAVEGVQAQTRVLMRTLRRLRIPTLIFVNKVDRRGARIDEVLDQITTRLTPDVVTMGSAHRVGSRTVEVRPGPDPALADKLADHDDGLLSALVGGEAVDLDRELAAQSRRGLVHPVFLGSAITGAGVAELSAGLTRLLPVAAEDSRGPLSAAVFKVERGAAGEKIAYARLFSGTLRVRDHIGGRPSDDIGRRPSNHIGDHPGDHPGGGPSGHIDGHPDDPRSGRTGDQIGERPGDRIRGRARDRSGDKVTGLSVAGGGRCSAVSAGQIARIWGLSSVKIGDTIGLPPPGAGRQFPPPSLQTVIAPRVPAERGALFAALTQLAEQDPLINLRHDLTVSLYGEVQKEVIEATLADEYALKVTFHETTTITIERPHGAGEAVELIGVEPNELLATVGLRIEPAPPGSGIGFGLAVELGSMPPAFFKAVEESVHALLGERRVTDCVVTMTHSGYAARQSHSHGTFDKSMSSTAGDFRQLTRRVLTTALGRAGTTVHEPIHRFTLEIPADTLGVVLPALAAARAVPLETTLRGPVCVIEGDIAAARVHAVQQRLPALTHGEGLMEAAFHHYARLTA